MWKVRRELRVGVTKLRMFYLRAVHDRLRKAVYDRTSDRQIKVTPGDLPMTDRVAIFIVFQPKGLAPSVVLTLEHLAQNRFSVVVVSNGPLRPEDRAAVARKATVVLERPNVGYDFGGYRDGIRHLWSLGHDTSLLVLMNDSTWFPLRRDDDSLERMEALDADLAGHIFKTESEEKRGYDHMESHLLMISRDFVRSSDFRHFWSSYRMSDERATTIAFGEKAFSQLAIKSGRKVRSLMSREWLLSVLGRLDDRDLERVLRHTIDSFSSKQPDLTEVRRLIQSGRPWRDAYLAWADKSLRNSRSYLLSAAFVMPALVYGKMGFSKKAHDIRFHMAREELLDLEAMGMIPPIADEVRAEIAEKVRAWVPVKGQEKMVRPLKAISTQAG
jgi:hypothetical protein